MPAAAALAGLVSLAACASDTPPPAAPPPPPRMTFVLDGRETTLVDVVPFTPASQTVVVTPTLVDGTTRSLPSSVTVVAVDTTIARVVVDGAQLRITGVAPGRTEARLRFGPGEQTLTINAGALVSRVAVVDPLELGLPGQGTLTLVDPLAGPLTLGQVGAVVRAAWVGPDTVPVTLTDSTALTAALRWPALGLGTWTLRVWVGGRLISREGSVADPVRPIGRIPFGVSVAWDHRPGRTATATTLTIGEETGLHRPAMAADTAIRVFRLSPGVAADPGGPRPATSARAVQDLLEVAPGRFRVTGLNPIAEVRVAYRGQDTTLRYQWLAVEADDFAVEVVYGWVDDPGQRDRFADLTPAEQQFMRTVVDSAARRWGQVLKGRRTAGRLRPLLDPSPRPESPQPWGSCSVGQPFDPRRVFRVAATTASINNGILGFGGACIGEARHPWATADTTVSPFDGRRVALTGPTVAGWAVLNAALIREETVRDRGVSYDVALHEIGHALGLVLPRPNAETFRWLARNTVDPWFMAQRDGSVFEWLHAPAQEAFLRALGRPEVTLGAGWQAQFSVFGIPRPGVPAFPAHWWQGSDIMQPNGDGHVSGISALFLEETADFLIDWRSVVHPVPAGKVTAVERPSGPALASGHGAGAAAHVHADGGVCGVTHLPPIDQVGPRRLRLP
ncbi:MAG: hypothetical protein MUF00_19860 [Gemmatimonadaceae bacterium]|nr:hypothetical protein [Gemmatimonadaceae bacterium]